MSGIDLTVGRWRWRRNKGLKTPAEMNVHPKDIPPSGVWTDALLKFTAQSVQLTENDPEPLKGMWFKGSVEMDDPYHDPLDNDAALGTYWAKVYPPTRAGLYSLLLFQYAFPVANPSADTTDPAVRIFSGHRIAEAPVTFFGYGMDNWYDLPAYTFSLTQEEWPQQMGTTPI
jgi:hypothetical protein